MGHELKVWFLLVLIAIQCSISYQQLTFARSWVRGEFANDEEGGNADYDGNVRQSQNKKAKGFYVKKPVSWNPPSAQLMLKDPNMQQPRAVIDPATGTVLHTRFQNKWNRQFPFLYQFFISNRSATEYMPLRRPHSKYYPTYD